VSVRPPLAVVGPTASGKTALSLEVARRSAAAGRPTELVSVDSMAVYRGMEVGTAAPSPAERGDVVVHCTGVVDPSTEFSMVEFVGLARSAMGSAAARGAPVVLVGGTGLYVRALVDGLEAPGQFPDVLAELDAEPDTVALHDRLAELDPVAAQKMEPSNRRRVLRALEVTVGSGRPFSSFGPGLEDYPSTDVVQVGLTVDRDALGPRIETRLREQLAQGFLNEVAELVARPVGWSRTAAQALGYRELAAHLAGECTLDEAVAMTVQRTRQFAVRQERWFRRDPRITWLSAVDGTDSLAEQVEAVWAAATPAGPSGTSH
jgi:tRNA dimethylallyltransferase